MFSLYFNVYNYTKSATADRLKVDNVPDAIALRNLLHLHAFLSELSCNITEIEFDVSSAYRCKLLNDAVKGAKNSAHLKGLACDLITKNQEDLRKLYLDIKNSDMNFDQLILYNSHVHVSIDDRMRRMAFAKIQHVDKDEASELHGF